MRGKYLIAIAFLACWTVITASKVPDIFKIENEQCPPVDTCPPKLISHETDCAKYYECKYGQRQLRSCAANLFFSKKWSGCVNRRISDCPSSDEQCPSVDTCPPKLISHEADCAKYYECKYGQKQLRFCAPGLFFSKRWSGCVSREISDCPVTPPPTPPPTPSTPPTTRPTPPPTPSPTPPPVETCPPVDTCPPKLISHADCDKYYECKYGQKQLRFCAPGLFFSKRWSGCVSREISDCAVTLPPTPPTPPPTRPTPPPTPPPTQPPIGECRHGELLPHECICTKFYECKYGRKAVRDCPAGHHFNPSTRTCEVGACTLPTNPPLPPPVCQEGEFLPHECQCNKYYQCKNGRKALRECDQGWHFDNSTRRCIPGTCNNPNPRCGLRQKRET